MRKHEQQKTNMYMTLDGLLKKNESILQESKAMWALYGRYNELIKDIHDKSEALNTVKSGKTDDKLSTQTDLKESMLSVGGALYTLGQNDKQPTLIAKANLKESAIKAMKDNDTVQLAEILLAEALANKEQLADYRVTEEVIAEFQSHLDAYKKARGNRDSSHAESDGLRQSLETLFTETHHLLKHRMDKLMKTYRKTHPEFYAQYESARKLRLRGIRHYPPDPPPDPVPDPSAETSAKPEAPASLSQAPAASPTAQ
jgi:hypothetical protein